MEWQNQEMQHHHQQGEDYLQYQIQNEVCGKVMTDEQVEELRKQIVAYSAISEQLAELHKSMSAHHNFTGIRLGNLYCDPISASVGHKITARQRWTPTALQLQILENIYKQGTGTPSKQKIKEIASELEQHGPISETNVYNWFQNRRARSKRKLQSSTDSVNAETDVSTKEKKTKPVDPDFITNISQGVESFYFQADISRGYDSYNNLAEQFGLLG
ncbi:hypothetical protein ERO13_A08G028800v2 [Gossypium hirsutum]|uniref:Homeobox domain-containing protein n=5 Tax=Gossypium TaxID=3633 RepID=A0A2P5YGX1_GOSBA|nr:WUSCHEL-related homeobox 8 [Gossypium hirsutum]KAB2068479.1 hypothetical protein ES319_A08G033900v1 [Gossypium barbadense]TYH04800.1 hypothetical protein ES288_A08G034800v1 [Gossypium darwinii]TYI13125.1 hypothetical protein ES332_A08G036800v1 [Gossypium tomentosum]TYJ21024.1 hypothetical protein E1A91_A08G036500v1 [Gossypium mustelinum]KAG4186213.1 hypothetical protein ERO13_A08G028800v2 [Gossypium hirsutum]